MTEFHRMNMRKHIAFLENNAGEIRKSFDMFNIFHNCGTPSCSLGYATVSIGMPLKRDQPASGVCLEYLGVRWFDKSWGYMFGYEWKLINNTPEAAAARMKAVLYNQVPLNWEFSPEFSHPIVIVPEEIQVKELELVQ